MDKDTKLIW